MSPDIIEQLGTSIDDIFFVFAIIIFAVEIAEAWFKGTLKGGRILEMLASASTQIPYLLVEALLMTGALYRDGNFRLYLYSLDDGYLMGDRYIGGLGCGFHLLLGAQDRPSRSVALDATCRSPLIARL